MTKNIVQMLLKLQQAWCHDYIPGELVPVCDHPLGEEPFPDTQLEPPLLQLDSIPLGPITGYQREYMGTCPSAPPCEEAVDDNEVSLSLSLSLLFSRLNRASDRSRSSYIFPSMPFTLFVALLWALSSSLLFFLYCGA